MSDSTITFVVLGVAVVLFVWDYLPVELVAIGAALSLYATGVLDLDAGARRLRRPDGDLHRDAVRRQRGARRDRRHGLGRSAADRRAPGESRSRLLVLTMLLVAALTALISVNGSVAALLPMVVVLAIRLRRPPSQLLLPLAFGAHAGSMLALTGTPVNVIVNASARERGRRALRVLRVRARRRPARRRHDRDRRPLRRAAAAAPQRRGDPARPQPPRAHAGARVPRSKPTRDVARHARCRASRRSSSRRARISSARRSTRAWSPTAATSSCSPCSAGARTSRTPAALAIGDALLLRGTWGALEGNLEADPDVLVVDAPALVRRQGVPLGAGAKRAHRRARRHGDPARDRSRAARRRRPARGRRDRPPAACSTWIRPTARSRGRRSCSSPA